MKMSVKKEGYAISRKKWHLDLRPRAPDMCIGGSAKPYIRRWYLFRTPLISLYLHNMLRDDDDRALHDHPWNNVSVVLIGGFVEVTPTGRLSRAPLSVTFRSATDAHRLELRHHAGVTSSWSLFFTGPYLRKWGFHCPKGWIAWDRFVKPDSPGEIGPGCDG